MFLFKNAHEIREPFPRSGHQRQCKFADEPVPRGAVRRNSTNLRQGTIHCADAIAEAGVCQISISDVV